MITHFPSKQVLASTTEWMNSPMERAKGLLKYESAPKSFGAIFKLPFFGFFPLVHTFGMKFEIDILFCDSQQRVISKFLNVRPGRLVMPWKFLLGGAAFLLEFSGCSLDQVNEGDQLQWEKS